MSQSGFDDGNDDEKSGYIIIEVDPIKEETLEIEYDSEEETVTCDPQTDNMIEIDIVDTKDVFATNVNYPEAAHLQQQQQLNYANKYPDYEMEMCSNYILKPKSVEKSEDAYKIVPHHTFNHEKTENAYNIAPHHTFNMRKKQPKNNLFSNRDYLRNFFRQRLLNNLNRNLGTVQANQLEQINAPQSILYKYLSQNQNGNSINRGPPQPDRKSYMCPKCGLSFKFKKYLTEHKKTYRGTLKCDTST